MNTQTLVTIAVFVAALMVVGIILWFVDRGSRSEKLREKYGPEYDYTMDRMGDRHAAEHSLREREKRINKLNFRNLEMREKDLYRAKWEEIQADFVDRPADSVEQANLLVQEVMEARGFPTADFEQRAADISVIYPEIVSNYRNANAIAEKSWSGGASTEDFRQAMVYFRSLFEELLGTEMTPEKELKVS